MAEANHRSKENTTINVTEVVAYLNRAFTRASIKVSDKVGSKAIRTCNGKGKCETTPMYDYQVEFSYLIDNIQRSPNYIVPKFIQEANALIASMEAAAA